MSDEPKALQKGAGSLAGTKFKVDQTKPMTVQERLAAAKTVQEAQKSTHITIDVREDEPIMIMGDDSGSMASPADHQQGYGRRGHGATKQEYLHQAIKTLAEEIDFAKTPTFSMAFNEEPQQHRSKESLKKYASTITADHGTPMHNPLEYMIESDIKRGILISDGDADYPGYALTAADMLANKRKVVDCIHIGNSQGGEETLKAIPEKTRGMFFKFTDVASFAKSLHMLAPKQRGMLASKTNEQIKLLTGATTVIK